jgi:uncharacterized protein YndB with AHSA1/START domain
MNTSEPILINQTLKAPADKVWRALTEPAQMKSWYFDIAKFNPEPGFEFKFKGGDENNTFLHLCKITEVIAGQKLAYTWCYEGFSGITQVTFELFPDGENTRLQLMHEGLESFPASEPALARQNFVEGWNYIIGKSLKDYLETVPNQ